MTTIDAHVKVKSGKGIRAVHMTTDSNRDPERSPMFWVQVYTDDDVDPVLLLPMTATKINRLFSRVPKSRMILIMTIRGDYDLPYTQF